MLKKRSIFRLATGVLLLALLAGLSLHPRAATQNYPPLAEEQMRTIRGGDGCTGCRYAGDRLDECYHAGWADDCATDLCIANYAIESTCDPGDGTCTAYENPDATSVVQYERQDVDCTTDNPWDWNIWFTHYYGSTCDTSDGYTRCEKLYTSCDGTLLATGTIGNGIVCP